MADDIRVIPEQDYDTWINIQVHAYPGAGAFSPEAKDKWKQGLIKERAEDGRMRPWGLYRDGRLIGGMKTYDYTMCLHGRPVLAGGVGAVAVDLAHKKERAAFSMIDFYLKHYAGRGAIMAALYPFRHDFYRKMGFGYGTRINQYRIKPSSLPSGKHGHVSMLAPDDIPALLTYYNDVASRTNGMMQYEAPEFQELFERTHFAAYRRDGRVLGYAAFSFRKAKEDNFLMNDMVIRQMFFEHEALPELMAFLNSQADQINSVIINSMDDGFFVLPEDPRDGSDRNLLTPVAHEVSSEGLGLMYRILDVRGCFRVLCEHSFGAENLTIRFDIEDSLIAANNAPLVVRFANGKPAVLTETSTACDVSVSMDISEFSSMLMGAVDFVDLYRYHRANISDASLVPEVNEVFRTAERPKCATYF